MKPKEVLGSDGGWLAIGRYTAAPLHRYTATPLRLRRSRARRPTKYEFLDGEIYAMAGGSEDHSALAAEVLAVRERRITVHHRDDDGTWSARVAISGGRVRVASIDAQLDVDAIYRKSSVGT